jgi:hypothetical protein
MIGSSQARDVRDVLGLPGAAAGGNDVIANALRPLGSVLGAQIANQIPTLSTSAGYTYDYNPELEVYERSARTFGPLFSERAITLGQGKFNVNFSYTYLDFDQINGHDLNKLTSRVERASLNGQDTFAGLIRPDLANQFNGLTQEQIFSEVIADLRLEAQIFDFSFTYGVLDNLDVNIDVPLVRTYAHMSVRQQILDPRFVQLLDPNFAAQQPTIFDGPARDREDAFGVGDVRLRSKYLGISGPVRVAGLLDFVMPTGSKSDFQGTGDWRLGTFLIASGTLMEIFEPHAQAGVEWNINDVDISQAKYGVGVTSQVTDFAAITLDFIGRSEFGRLGRIPNSGRLPRVDNGEFATDANGNLLTDANGDFTGRPLFVDIKRNDVLDLALGTKIALTEQIILFATVTLPLNQDGLRAEFVPTGGIEASF